MVSVAAEFTADYSLVRPSGGKETQRGCQKPAPSKVQPKPHVGAERSQTLGIPRG